MKNAAPRSTNITRIQQICAVAAICAAIVFCLKHFFAAMDDYHDMRSWDSCMSSATRAHLEGDYATTSEALEQARKSALALSHPEPYLEITDNQIATSLLKDDPEKAARYFQSSVDALEKSAPEAGSGGTIAEFQLVYARNRLGLIKVDKGDKSEANKLFQKNLRSIEAIKSSKVQNADILPFRVEEFVALVGSMDSIEEDRGKRSLKFFERACALEDSYIVDESNELRFQNCAQALREIEYRENDETPITLPFELPARTSQVEANIELVRSYILQALSSRFRTRHDDANLIVTTIRLAEILQSLQRLPEARKILIAAARQTSRESLVTTGVWRDLINALDNNQRVPESINLLKDLINQPYRSERLDPFLKADLLFELGRRELRAGGRSAAIAHLTESLKLFELKCYKIGALSVSSTSRRMKAVQAVLARANSQ